MSTSFLCQNKDKKYIQRCDSVWVSGDFHSSDFDDVSLEAHIVVSNETTIWQLFFFFSVHCKSKCVWVPWITAHPTKMNVFLWRTNESLSTSSPLSGVVCACLAIVICCRCEQLSRTHVRRNDNDDWANEIAAVIFGAIRSIKRPWMFSRVLTRPESDKKRQLFCPHNNNSIDSPVTAQLFSLLHFFAMTFWHFIVAERRTTFCN